MRLVFMLGMYFGAGFTLGISAMIGVIQAVRAALSVAL